MSTEQKQQSKEITIVYKNWRGETGSRRILPELVWFGSTEWHPEEQWFMKAFDVSKKEVRDFALLDISSMQSSPSEQLLTSPQELQPLVQKKIKLFADGGSRGNPGPSASGYVLMDMDNGIIVKGGVYLGVTTNNQAEYQALKLGLEAAQKAGAREVAVHMDSMLVVNQMKGIFKVKNRDLWPIHESIKELASQFKKVTYTHVPRELNKLADAEVNTTLDAEAGK